MQLFLLRVFLLFITFNISVGLLYVMGITIIKKRVTFNFEQKDIVLLGNSLASNGVDPNETKQKLINLAAEGEPFFWTYYKTKILLTNHLSADTFLIEITPNQFAENYNPVRRTKLIGFLPRYAPFLEYSDILEIHHHSNTGDFFYAVRKGPIRWAKNFVEYGQDWTNVIGGYKPKTGFFRNKDDDEKAKEINLSGKSLNSVYFKRLIALLNKENKVVFLYHSPKPDSQSLYWNIREANSNTLIHNMALNRPPIIIDHNFARLPDSLFADKLHLNTEGSKKFSRALIVGSNF